MPTKTKTKPKPEEKPERAERKFKTFQKEFIGPAFYETEMVIVTELAEIVREMKALSVELSGNEAAKHLAGTAASCGERLEKITTDHTFCVLGQAKYTMFD